MCQISTNHPEDTVFYRKLEKLKKIQDFQKLGLNHSSLQRHG